MPTAEAIIKKIKSLIEKHKPYSPEYALKKIEKAIDEISFDISVQKLETGKEVEYSISSWNDKTKKWDQRKVTGKPCGKYWAIRKKTRKEWSVDHILTGKTAGCFDNQNIAKMVAAELASRLGEKANHKDENKVVEAIKETDEYLIPWIYAQKRNEIEIFKDFKQKKIAEKESIEKKIHG